MLREATKREIEDLVSEVRSFLRRCDWSEVGFSLEKAALGAALSQIAYCVADKDEIEATTRAKVVPSKLFQEVVASGSVSGVSSLALERDIRIDVVTTSTLVAAVVKESDYVLIAIRGTQFMYDWKINLQATKWYSSDTETQYFLHSGFLKEAMLLSARLHRMLAPHLSSDAETKKICVFGHSLGGAVAAILKIRGIRERDIQVWDEYKRIGSHCILKKHDNFTYPVDHCYTYGSPRIASERICSELRTYAVRRSGDLIPTTPPQFMEYGDYLEQFTCTGLDWRARDATSGWLDRAIRRIWPKNSFRQHLIDGYKKEIFDAIKNGYT